MDMNKERIPEMVPISNILRKKKIATRGGSEKFYNIGYTENTISPRGPKTYRYE